MNFFDPDCQSGPYQQAEFGLCDAETAPMAWVATAQPEGWIATVNNPRQQAVTFTAIDKCAIKDGEAPGRGRCDCMLTTDTALYLVELKDRESRGWRSEAKQQLISTIELLGERHDLSQYRHKKAFICNRRRRPFAVVDHQEQRDFFSTYRFRLDVQATVLIV